ncbi:hypothetical protein EB796_019971 [Bugula neritina]|uniref:Peptidase metallopeptidase domain-containing protein n=1 Tax=Bugula neritina TaxID=10212 RepID=A0A7J7J656_BUGNE|nr:hypothetical protein EB796_019971 [Bugula neritina]
MVKLCRASVVLLIGVTVGLSGVFPSPLQMSAAGETSMLTGHRMKKRWVRFGSQIWKHMPVTINFKEYLAVFSPWQQLKVLHECTKSFTIEGKLWFKILQSDVKADISIYFEHFDGHKRYGMYGSGMEPQPGKTSWVRLEKEENWKLRRSSKPTGQQGRGKPVSFKFTLCHEIGHALGLDHVKDRNSIMYAFNEDQNDDGVDEDTRTGLQKLYGAQNPIIRG